MDISAVPRGQTLHLILVLCLLSFAFSLLGNPAIFSLLLGNKNKINLRPVLYHLVGYKYVSKPWAQPCYHPMNKLWLKYFSCLKFESNKDIISYKLKKYGLFREVVCYLWNVCYKIPAFRTVEFLVEKNNVRRRCAQLAKD